MTGTRPKLRFWSPWLAVFVVGWLVCFFALNADPLGLVRAYWPLIFVGILGGTLGNATAVGGGLVFIPTLMFFYRMEPLRSLQLALASQSFGMTSGAIGWLNRKSVALDALPYALPGLFLGSLCSTLIWRPNAFLIKGLFGPISIAVGLITLFLLNRLGSSDRVPRRALPGLVLVSFLGGLVTGWVAIGEGELVAAFLVLGYGLKPERGIGLGTLLLSANSIFLTLLHQFFVGGIPWSMAAFTILGCVFGGRMGPFITQWMGPKRLKTLFAVIAIGDGLLFVIQFMLFS
ncbi:MAG: sulfite exporter TauE/SafE family protein [Acidobacteria bacterium]|nr:sulfite exporter TauE/SafE family protein [Acidobacteriota bacterium]